MNDLVQKWLNLVCTMLPRVSSAIVVRHDIANPVAIWPIRLSTSAVDPATTLSHDQATDLVALRSTVELAIQQHGPVLIEKSDQHRLLIAHPLQFSEMPGSDNQGANVSSVNFGVLGLILEAGASEKQVINRLLDWSCAWLKLLLERASPAEGIDFEPGVVNAASSNASSIDLHGLIQLSTRLMDLDDARQHTTILVSMMADYFSAKRGYLARLNRGNLKLEAISNEASFDAQVNIVGMAEAAMHEAIDLAESVHFAHGDTRDLVAHEMFVSEVNATGCSTILLRARDSLTGVLLLEWDSPIASTDHVSGVGEVAGNRNHWVSDELTDLTGALFGSLLTLRDQSQLGIVSRLGRSVREVMSKVVGPDWLVPKLLALMLLAVFLFSWFVEGTYEVSASATLEGKTQQAIVAPYDGFIASAEARAGDTVRAGQVLGRMEDKDLLLEMQQVESEKDSLNRQYRQALSDLNQSEARILKAKLSQVEAREALLAYQYQRVALTTPIDGIVLTGDLSRSKGAPVEQGQLLFEIAPLQSYLIVLMIAERDIGDIKPGMSGEVLLASHPGLKIPFIIEHISNVLVSAETSGVVFRTEGVVSGDFDVLRPGMEGFARVNIEQRPYAWIWFHRLFDWWRVKSWQYLP